MRNGGVRIALGIIAFAVGLTMWRRDARRSSADSADTAAQPPAAPPTFTRGEFNALRYLEGAWKGTLPNGGAFYESYHFRDDSTIFMASHTDSTLTTRSDSALIVFRGGAVIDSGHSVSRATTLDSTTVDFMSGPASHFSWTRQGNDAWVANLYNIQPDGTVRTTTYQMRRIRQ